MNHVSNNDIIWRFTETLIILRLMDDIGNIFDFDDKLEKILVGEK